MNNTFILTNSKRKVLILSVIFFTLFFSCKKDGELYPKFNSENLIVSFTDTFSIKTKVMRDDSIPTLNVNTNLVGIYNDSIFGLSSASFYSEITLAGANVSFGSDPIIDSVVLSLKYKSAIDFYGEISTPMNINVFQLNEEISGEEYHSAQDLNLITPITPIGNFNDTIFINSYDTINGVAYEPHMRIRLDTAIGQMLLNEGKGNNVIENNDALKAVFKGFYITPSTSVTTSTLQKGEGAIVSFDVNSDLSTITLYYHNGSGSTQSTYSFLINSESKKFNRFDHNYTGTDIEKQLNLSNYDSTVTYVQSLGGVKTKIEIPHIKELSKIENVIINKAELVIPLKENSNLNLAAINTFVLTGINESGDPIFLIDNFEGSDYFGGTIDYTNKTYKFNIARHIQQIINNSEQDYGLYLIAKGSAISANRSILNSAKNTTSKIKLNITYSKP